MNRLNELLNENRVLSGILCRDPTFVDMELLAQLGYNAIWMDLEHSPTSMTEATRLSRTITHLGMLPMARIIELTRTHVQALLDGGFEVLILPDVKDAAQAAEFVRLGKYPPAGQRGASSTAAGINYNLGSDPRRTLEEANKGTHLMVMIESDEAFGELDAILQVDGIDMVTVGPMDWTLSRGAFSEDVKAGLAPKIDQVVSTVAAAGKIPAMTVATAEQAKHFADLGARVILMGVDVGFKRKAFAGALAPFQEAFGN